MDLTDFVTFINRQAELIEVCHHAIMLLDRNIYVTDKYSYLVCKSTGGHCTPACSRFDPSIACDYSDLSLQHQTFVEAYWDYRVKSSKQNTHWRLFYECFHPKTSEETQHKKFDAEFPNDVPALNNQQAISNHQVNKNLDSNDPAYWSSARLDAAVKGNELKRRMASTDWDWRWYDQSTKAGKVVDMVIAKNKNKFDKLMHNEFGEDYEDTGSYTYSKTKKDYIRLSSLYEQLKDLLFLNLDFITQTAE